MTIKKQFTLLAVILIAIPIFCVCFVSTYRYIKSPDRYMITGYKEIRKLDLSENDIKTLEDTLHLLPPDIETIVADDFGQILFSNIKEFPKGSLIDPHESWRYINQTSDKYFYQFTSPKLESNKHAIMMTRVLRDKREKEHKNNLMTYVLIFLFFIVCVCVVLVALISQNIFRSIMVIKSKTDQLSKGNLSTPITISPKEKKENVNEITTILDSLEEMRQSLLEAQNRKSKFIMGISHDLRTPVAIIKGYTEALKDGIITDEAEIKNTYDLIEGKTDRLESMITTLINYMKLNETEIREKLEVSSITKLITDFAKEAEITGNVYHRKVTTEISLPENREIPLNAQLVNRAFENIFSNALRYTKEDNQINLISYEDNNNIIFKIKDNGIGIAEKDLDHIFELFYRGTNSRREEGMGIGLSVVKNIIDTHEWDIKVDSEKDKGTTFTIIIPIKK